MIKTQNLRYSYDRVRQLSFPDVNVDTGEALLVLGQSGVGKTTFLHLLGGLIKPLSGSIKVGNKDIGKMSIGELNRFRGNNIGIVFQTPHFVQALSIKENLLLGQKLGGRKKSPKEIDDLLNRLEIGNRINALPSNLSQGELQRASIARAIVNEPALILADEPTSALDDKNTNEVIEILKDMAQGGGSALVIVTHDKRLKDVFDNQMELS